MLLFDKREFRAHWFETGTPTFLVKWLRDRGFYTPKLEKLYGTEALLSAFDVERIEPEAMLWQTGYLTLRKVAQHIGVAEYELGVPNLEVRSALNQALLVGWHPAGQGALAGMGKLLHLLEACDHQGLRDHFDRLYAAIPHDWHRKNPIAQYEGYWASVFYSHIAALGLDIQAEDVSSQGRCDLVIRYKDKVWIIEFKLVGDQATGEAIQQLKAKNYAANYRKPGVTVIELGIEFSQTQRQIVGWDVVTDGKG